MRQRKTSTSIAHFVSVLVAMSLSSLPLTVAQETVTVLFDNTGEEAGITPPGATTFSFEGSNWRGGTVATAGNLALYASGIYSYEIGTGGGEVGFDVAVDSAQFFFVHRVGFQPGTARAFNQKGDLLLSVESRQETTFADPDNFVTLDPEGAVDRIELTGGIIDNFTFTTQTGSTSDIPLGEVTIELTEVAAGLVSPVTLTHAGDGSGRLFVVDQTGSIRVIKDGALLPVPFLDLSEKIVQVNASFDERGLLGLAFHPDYAQTGRFFVRYSAPREGLPEEPCNNPQGPFGCHKEVLAEYRVSSDPDVADPASERVIYEVDKPEFNHNAGHVLFGPDGLLYFSFGDGGGRDDGLSSTPPAHGPIGNGQNIETALGSLLRIDVNDALPFAVPPDNPFVGSDGLDEIYAYGFRNPYRFSFDRGGSQELFLADVGQDLFEEVDVVVNGGNYGWALREGAHCFDPLSPSMPPADCPADGLIDPVAEYDHSEGIAVVGGFVYRRSTVGGLEGKYVFGDFSRDFGPTGRLFYLDAEGDRSRIFELQIGQSNEPLGRFLKGFGEDEDGELYVLTSTEVGPTGTTGQVLRIAPPPSGRQVPGDCNQDGQLDISDAICVFGVLFLGTPAAFPCGDGTPGDPGNMGLLDWQGDEAVDISDGIAALSFLFSGGPAHPLAIPGSETTACAQVAQCDTSSQACQ